MALKTVKLFVLHKASMLKSCSILNQCKLFMYLIVLNYMIFFFSFEFHYKPLRAI